MAVLLMIGTVALTLVALRVQGRENQRAADAAVAALEQP
jgi:hypothetical protein